jgi:glutathione S-transferase
MNSNGLAPTIQDGNFVLWESNSLIRYLAAHCGPGTLEPRRPSQLSTGERDIQNERLYSLQLADERICRYLYGSGEKNRVARMQTNE